MLELDKKGLTINMFKVWFDTTRITLSYACLEDKLMMQEVLGSYITEGQRR
jgi:hypothetical protein